MSCADHVPIVPAELRSGDVDPSGGRGNPRRLGHICDRTTRDERSAEGFETIRNGRMPMAVTISGLSLAAPEDVVGHAGQALTLPAARGRHIFTAVKRYLVDWVMSRGLVGMYSEATAAHPYSQQALLDLGGHETGFLLGFIPESVDNRVSVPSPGRQSAALFFLRVRPGKERRLYAPSRHREIVRDTIEICDFRAQLADAPVRSDLPQAPSSTSRPVPVTTSLCSP